MSEPANGLREDLWTFPCSHNLKVMGLSHHPLIDIIAEIVRAEVPDFQPADARTLPSRTGKYHSITVTVQIERREQLENIYRALASREEISWTL
jgi:putative lipoic acid-binding regulatory protein